ncbi:MAG: TetR/AcrR family transcriptional regulator C-terminal domain-containing protein [Mycobacterium sp.]|nr:TetR/AcrR family transcriptional regulator C-terminal domain-containing protein [Mycobacterium sp.]
MQAAIATADREGLAAVSMRRLAAVLQARTMSLYSHVANKDELLDLMLDELAREGMLGPDLPPHWREAAKAIAIRTRELALAHPWCIELFGQRAQLGPNTMRLLEERVQALDELALAPATAWSAITVLHDYVLGYAVREIAQASAVPADKAEAKRWQASVGGYLTELADSGDFPRIAPLLRAGYGMAADNFQIGLDWLLDSIERQFASPRPSKPARNGPRTNGAPVRNGRKSG